MPSVAEIKAGLATGKEEANKALVQLAAVAAALDKAIIVLQATAAGSGQPKITHAVGKLVQAKAKLVESGALVRAAMVDTDSYTAVI